MLHAEQHNGISCHWFNCAMKLSNCNMEVAERTYIFILLLEFHELSGWKTSLLLNFCKENTLLGWETDFLGFRNCFRVVWNGGFERGIDAVFVNFNSKWIDTWWHHAKCWFHWKQWVEKWCNIYQTNCRLAAILLLCNVRLIENWIIQYDGIWTFLIGIICRD